MRDVRRDAVIDNYHGWKIADPYRWLEDPHAEDTKAWSAQQNETTLEYLRSVPARQQISDRLTELYNHIRAGLPHAVGSRYFYLRADGLQNQPALYIQNGLDGESSLLIDPNTLREDGTMAIVNFEPSPDGRWLAYSTSVNGSDWQEVRIRNVEAGEDESEVLHWCKFTNIAWTRDSAGFFYSRFPEVARGEEYEQTNFHHRVYYHRIGTAQSEDVLVYERPDHKEWNFHPAVSDDGRYVYLIVTHGTDSRTRFYCRDMSGDGEMRPVFDDFDASYWPIGNDGSTFYFHTNRDAPKGRIVAVNLAHPEPSSWREIVPEQDDPIDFVTFVNNQFAVAYLHHAHHDITLFDGDGRVTGRVQLPTMGSVLGLAGERDAAELFVHFASFLSPTQVLRYDFAACALTPFVNVHMDSFDASEYETTQVFFTSKDGTKIPMFLTHKRGLPLDGNRPTILYGYGGFNLAQTPKCSVPQLVWLEHGGVYAVANLRGGNEYGEEWHRSGMLSNKQNVFDDFIAAAEWLVEHNYTQPSRLAIMGRSNGGLLTAACMVQRPDLYGAVVSVVPVTDMLRYQNFTAGRYWVSEYGSAERSLEEFRTLYEYSPLHNVRQGTVYPPVLITTGDTDDRVVPMHSKKLAATLQEAAAPGGNPVWLRIDSNAGHGMGKPIAKLIEEDADVFAFLFDTLGVK